MTPRKRSTGSTLPPGMYRHGRKIRKRIYVNGKPDWETVDARTDDEAWAVHNKKLAPAAGTIGAGIRRYMTIKVPELIAAGDLSANTWRTERRRCEALIEVFGHMRPDSLTTGHLYKYGDEAADGWRKLKRLSAIWKYLIRWELASKDPFFSQRGGGRFDWPKQKARDRYVTDVELAAALEVALEDGKKRPASLRAWAVLKLVLLAGRRITDIRKITLAQIEKNVGIRFKESKTKKVKTVKWSPKLEAAIDEIKARLHVKTKVVPFLLICNVNGHELSEGSLNQAFQRLRPKFIAAGIEPFQPRDIRAKHGTDHKDGFKSLGHSDRRTFDKHYNRLGDSVEPLE